MSKLKIKDGNQWTEIPAGGVGVPSGGNAGDVLVKSSSVDYATEWADLPNLLTWTLWDSKAGNVDITLPTNYNEILIATQYTTNGFDYSLTVYIPRPEVMTSNNVARRFFTGWNPGSRCDALFLFSSDLTKVKLSEFYVDGSSQIGNATVRLYYR